LHREFDVSTNDKDGSVKSVKERDESQSDSGDEEDVAVDVGGQQSALSKRKVRVKVDGVDAPAPASTFEDMKLPKWLNDNISNSLGWLTPTLVQSATIPALAQARDVIITSPTGSGKTGAYLIPVLSQLGAGKHLKALAAVNKEEGTGGHCLCVVVTPTRELSQQIYMQCKKLFEGFQTPTGVTAVVNLSKAHEDVEAARAVLGNTAVVIATPQRLLNALQFKMLTLDSMSWLVLDEVDRLLGIDFIKQTDSVIAACPATKHVGLFSATFTPQVEQIAQSLLTNPIRIVIGAKHTVVENVEQTFQYVASEEGKLLAIRQLVMDGKLVPPALLFVQSKDRAMQLYKQLIVEDDVRVDLVTSDRTDTDRDRAIASFRSGNTWLLITTDLLARGMDLASVHTVINYDVPSSAAQYIHRVGRAGRGHLHGRTTLRPKAINFVTDADVPRLQPIIGVVLNSGQGENIPVWMLDVKPPRRDTRRKMHSTVVKRDAIDPTMTEAEKKKKFNQNKKRKFSQNGSQQKAGQQKKQSNNNNNNTKATLTEKPSKTATPPPSKKAKRNSDPKPPARQ
jgi:ATP-dependent RNA helicase DDX52/ROK1